MPVRINCPPEVAVLTLTLACRADRIAKRARKRLHAPHATPRARAESPPGTADAPRRGSAPTAFPPCRHRSTGTAACSDDRAAIELRGHEMHGRAADAHAVLERLPLRVEARKRRAAATGGCSECDSGNASSSGAPTSRMKPARQTSPTSRSCSEPDDQRDRRRRGRECYPAEDTWLRSPRARARDSPCASARFEITTATVASSSARAMASMIDWRLLPRPEMRTASRCVKWGRGDSSGTDCATPT